MHSSTCFGVISEKLFKPKSLLAYEDGISGGYPVSMDIVWYAIIGKLVEHTTTTRPVILFCSVNTMYRILRTLNLITYNARIIISSGGYLVINIPRNALPSFNRLWSMGVAVPCMGREHQART